MLGSVVPMQYESDLALGDTGMAIWGKRGGEMSSADTDEPRLTPSLQIFKMLPFLSS